MFSCYLLSIEEVTSKCFHRRTIRLRLITPTWFGTTETTVLIDHRPNVTDLIQCQTVANSFSVSLDPSQVIQTKELSHLLLQLFALLRGHHTCLDLLMDSLVEGIRKMPFPPLGHSFPQVLGGPPCVSTTDRLNQPRHRVANG